MTSSDLVLVADIGGTFTRFGLVQSGDVAPSAIEELSNDGYAGLHETVPYFLEKVSARPKRAVIAVAGPIKGGTVHLTNRRGWSFAPDDLAAKLGLQKIDVINDFAALACSLPFLGESDLAPIGSGRPQEGTKVILGPGTGLGVAALVERNGRRVACASEAGHIEFAPLTEREAAAYAAIRRQFGRVSAEFIASGTGIARLDAALASVDGKSEPGRLGPEISAAARAGEPRAREVMDMFFAALARFAGDMALAFVAQGGVYIFGGVAQKTRDLMDDAAFRRDFAAKAPHDKLVAGISTSLVTARFAALTGCAAIACDGL